MFLAFGDVVHPGTGLRLTVRKNSKRREAGKTGAKRRGFYDLTICPLKSVSEVALL